MSATQQCTKSGDRCHRKRATRAGEPSPGATETISAGMIYYKDSAAPADSSGDVITTTNLIASESADRSTSEQSSSFVHDTLPIVVVLSTLMLVALMTLLCVYCHARRYRRREQLKSSASGVDSGSMPSPMLEVAVEIPVACEDVPIPTPTPTPTPPPLPPTPPPSPQPPPRAAQVAVAVPVRQQSVGRRAQRREQRYTISTLQIEPMTRRLTMDLNEPGRSVVIRNRDAQGTDHVVNLIPLREEPESQRQTSRVRLPCFG